MNRQTKLKLVEKLNNEFEDLLNEKQRANYGSYMRAINEEVIQKVPKTKKEVRDIVKKYNVDTKVAAKMFTVLSGVENYLLNDPTRKSRELLKPLEPIMRAYSVKSPKTFAQGIYDMTAGRNTSERSKRFKPALLSYYDGFTENIESLEKQNQRALQRTEVEKASQVFKDLEELREARVPIREAKQILIDKYNDPKRVTTALNTELHEQAERTKLEQSKFMGYTHKRWNTQGDERVRRTSFHNSVKGKAIPIDSAFKGGGQSADYPGDVTLDVGERINCRCFITYHNEPQAKISTRNVIIPPTFIAAPSARPTPPTTPRPSLIPSVSRFAPKEFAVEAIKQSRQQTPNIKFEPRITSKINTRYLASSINSYGDLVKSNKLFEKYDIILQTPKSNKSDAIASYSNKGFMVETDQNEKQEITISFYQNYGLRDSEKITESVRRNIDNGWNMPIEKGKELNYHAEHEFGHFVQMKVLTENHYIKKVDEGKKLFGEWTEGKTKLQEIDKKYEEKYNEIKQRAASEGKTLSSPSIEKEILQLDKAKIAERKPIAKKFFENEELIINRSATHYKNEALKIAAKRENVKPKDYDDFIKKNTSVYGLTNDKEFFAEHFAGYRLNSSPNPLTKAFGQVVEGALDDSTE